jgi:Uma2 family endonuclease
MAIGTDTSESLSQRAAFPPMPVCRLGVDQYEEMIRAGIIMEDDPIELLDGWLVPKMTKNAPHVLVSGLVRNTIQRILPEGWCIYSQDPVRLATSMPEPDVMVVRGDLREYRERLPRGEDVGLIVEVADASLSRDQEFKKTLYAQAGIPVYWIVNLIDGRVEEYTNPAGSAENVDYGQRRDYSVEEGIPVVLEGRHLAMIPVRNLLP